MNKNNKLPVFELLLTDEDTGISKVSLVEYPAVESDFVAFNKDEPLYFKDDLKHRITGVIINAETNIYRSDSTYGEHYVFFSKDTIEHIQERFMKDKLIDQVNVQHTTDIKDVYLIELFIKDSTKGINPIEFSNIPEGSLIGTYKVENEEVWNEIINGNKFNGFSLEGYFGRKEVFNIVEPKSRSEWDEINSLEELIEVLNK